MAQTRFYSSTATRTSLSGSVSSTQTTITVGSTAGFPASLPYALIIERDTINEEIVDVTAAAGTTLTVTRGVDGTSNVSHTVGATVEHGVSARDFTEAGAKPNLTSTAPVTQAAGDAAAVGARTDAAKADHVHGMPAFAGTGAAATLARSDHTHTGYGTAWVGTIPLLNASSTAAWPWGVNGAVFTRVRIQETVTLTSLSFAVATQSGNYDIGIYTSVGGLPSARLVSTGTTAVPATGTGTATIASTTLNAGTDYWFAMACSTGAAAFYGMTLPVVISTGIGTLHVRQVSSGFLPLPATASGTSTAASGNNLPLIGFTV